MAILCLSLMVLLITQASHAQTVTASDIALQHVEAMDVMRTSLGLIDEVVDKMIPWDKFREIIDALEANSRYYPDNASKQIGEISTLLSTTHDIFNNASNVINKWCRFAVPLLETYKELFAYKNVSQVAEVQKDLLLKVLEEGQKDMTSAVVHFHDSISNLSRAYGMLTEMKLELENESRRGSARYQVAINDLRISSFKGALKVLLSIGVIITFIYWWVTQRFPHCKYIVFALVISAIVSAIASYTLVEYVLIPDLEKSLVQIQTLFDNLVSTTQRAQTDVGKIKEKLQRKIREQSDLSAQINVTETITNKWATLPVPMLKSMNENVQRLIKMCERYISNAGNEENHMYRHAYQEENSENDWSLFRNRTDL